MKILFRPLINPEFLTNIETMADFLADSMFHGLRSLLGDSVVDYPYLWHHMSEEREERPARFRELYGRGFTLFGLLPHSEIDRDDIPRKIETGYFDLVVLGTHCTGRDYGFVRDTINYFSEYYPPNKLAFLDGLDEPKLMDWELRRKTTYFKREHQTDDKTVHPISFSIPREKFRLTPVTKEKPFSRSHPQGGYLYWNEKEYYDDYAASYFGVTTKKGGWDCMRHLEIIAAGAVPYFPALEDCPPDTLFRFPKTSVLHARHMPGINERKFEIDMGCFPAEQYHRTQTDIQEHALKWLTTEAMANYFLSKIATLR